MDELAGAPVVARGYSLCGRAPHMMRWNSDSALFGVGIVLRGCPSWPFGTDFCDGRLPLVNAGELGSMSPRERPRGGGNGADLRVVLSKREIKGIPLFLIFKI